jgi:hypothetical protein
VNLAIRLKREGKLVAAAALTERTANGQMAF